MTTPTAPPLADGQVAARTATPQALPRAAAADLYGGFATLAPEENAVRLRVREFMETRVRSIATDCWEPGERYHEVVPDVVPDVVKLDLPRTAYDPGVLAGQKTWIGNAAFGDVVVVWARDEDSPHVKGVVVRTKDDDTENHDGTHRAGSGVRVMGGKIAQRAVPNALRTLTGLRVPGATYSYEGANEIDSLIGGRAPTGIGAFA